MSQDLEPCPKCLDERTAGDPVALNCSACKGTGFRRKSNTYVCNRCAGSLMPLVYKENRPSGEHFGDNSGPHGLVDAEVSGGYHSHFLNDMSNYRFSLCEKCLRELFTSFKVPPKVWLYPPSDTDTYADDLEAFNRRLWRQSDAFEARFAEGRCNANEACNNKATVVKFCSESMTSELSCDEHKGRSLASNNREVPIGLLQGLPYISAYKGTYTVEQCRQMTSAWLNTMGQKSVWFRYLPGEIDLILGFDQHTAEGREAYKEVSGFWVASKGTLAFEPIAISVLGDPNALSKFKVIELDGGTLYVGPQKLCSQLYKGCSFFVNYYRVDLLTDADNADSGPVVEEDVQGSEEPGLRRLYAYPQREGLCPHPRAYVSLLCERRRVSVPLLQPAAHVLHPQARWDPPRMRRSDQDGLPCGTGVGPLRGEPSPLQEGCGSEEKPRLR